MEMPEDMRDGPPGSIDSGPVLREAKKVPGDMSDLPRERVEVPEGLEIPDDELKLARVGGEEGKFDPGVDQFFDPHRDGLRDGSLGADGMKDVIRGDDVGLQDADRGCGSYAGYWRGPGHWRCPGRRASRVR